MEASLRCTAYNGRYLMMGFASNKVVADEPFLVPRRVALGNVKLCGVLLAYANEETRQLVKTAMGWNFPPTALGSRIMEAVVGLYEQHAIRAVVGRTATFAEIPEAIDSMGRRNRPVARSSCSETPGVVTHPEADASARSRHGRSPVRTVALAKWVSHRSLSGSHRAGSGVPEGVVGGDDRTRGPASRAFGRYRHGTRGDPPEARRAR